MTAALEAPSEYLTIKEAHREYFRWCRSIKTVEAILNRPDAPRVHRITQRKRLMLRTEVAEFAGRLMSQRAAG